MLAQSENCPKRKLHSEETSFYQFYPQSKKLHTNTIVRIDKMPLRFHFSYLFESTKKLFLNINSIFINLSYFIRRAILWTEMKTTQKSSWNEVPPIDSEGKDLVPQVISEVLTKDHAKTKTYKK